MSRHSKYPELHQTAIYSSVSFTCLCKGIHAEWTVKTCSHYPEYSSESTNIFDAASQRRYSNAERRLNTFERWRGGEDEKHDMVSVKSIN